MNFQLRYLLPKLFVLFLFLTTCFCYSQKRPFMLVTEDMYPEIIEKSKQNKGVFANLRNRALKDWKGGSLNYNTLLYIIDPENKARYREKIIDNLYSIETRELNTSHGGYVGNANFFFMSLVAMDIIYNDLSKSQIARIEKNFERIGNFYKDVSAAWALSRLGVNTTYAIYKGDKKEIAYRKKLYDQYLFEKSLMEDGSWGQSPGYSWFRMLGNRISKTTIVDMLQFTGNGDYYNDPRMINFHEWVLSFALTPFQSHTFFGDTGHLDPYVHLLDKFWYSDNYGPKVKGMLDWYGYSNGGPASYISSSLFVYLLRDRNTKHTPKMPVSLLKEQSGASLWGKTNSKEAFQGILYNLKGDLPGYVPFGHAHPETNSFDISGYGQHLIMNSGVYYGNSANLPFMPPGGIKSGTLKNVVLIGDKTSHDRNDGNGLIDGVVGGNVEFATTDAGNAIQNGSHKRTLHLVHAKQGISNGYFVVHDEVKPDNIKDKVTINFQVNTKHKQTKEITKNLAYQAPINGFVIPKTTDKTEKVNLFFASKPNVSIAKSMKAVFRRNPNAILTDNVKAEYKASADGYVRATTVIFPEDGTHAKPPMFRLSSSNYSGVKINHSNDLKDFYLGANPLVKNTYDNVIEFKASTTYFRRDRGNSISYTVSNGTQFLDTRGIYGFVAQEPVSIQIENNKGFVNASKQTFIKFYKKNIVGVKINGKQSKPFEKGSHYIGVYLPKGKSSIEMVLKSTSSSSLSVSFTTPDKNNFEIGKNIIVDVAATDKTSTIQKVDLYFNGMFVRTEKYAPYTWNATNQNDPLLRNIKSGEHTLKVIATNNKGQTVEATKSILVGKFTVALRQKIKKLYKTGQSMATIQANASAPYGKVVSVELYLDGEKLNRSPNRAPEWWDRYNPEKMRNLSAGKHTVKIVATDNFGLTKELNETILVGSPPAVSFSGEIKKEYKPTQNMATIRADTNDEDGFIAVVSLYLDGKKLNGSPKNSSEWWERYNPLMRNLSAGKHTLRLVAIDNIGMTTEVTETILVGNPPSVSFALPSTDNFRAGSNLTVLANVSDKENDFKKVELFFDGKPVTPSPANKKQWWSKYDPLMRNLKFGKHTLKLVATDALGLSSEVIKTILVGTPPLVSFVSPTNNIFKVASNLTVRANASDKDNDFKKVELFFDGNFVNPSPANNKEWWSKYDPLMRNLQAGKHTLKLVATDNLGITAEATKTILVGSPPKVSFVRPTRDTFKTGENLSVLATVSDSEGNFKKVELFFDGKQVTPSPANNKEWWSKYDPLMRNLKEGSHTLKLVATDDLGMSSEATMIITVNDQGTSAKINKYKSLVSIFPNPVKGRKFTISLSSTKLSKISILDLQGKIIYKEQFNAKEIQLNSTLFPVAAVYFIRVEQEGKTITKKIIVE